MFTTASIFRLFLSPKKRYIKCLQLLAFFEAECETRGQFPNKFLRMLREKSYVAITTYFVK